eukprot:TRINITY_DN1533_c0_g1_i5.p1 TRINITY_DN1533_c0_g1~~TRINITY_DN1533_c0_g1_i5.p1  ORF type:complete len:424 (+),score=66.44 TRINITY_DN1533_c0_g1_i5:176-1447(+)
MCIRDRYALVGGTAALVALLLWGSQAGPPGDSILLEMEEEKTLPVQFDEKCAQRFKPVVYLSVGEKYGPSPLEAFLATCTMRRGMRCGDTRKINFAYGGEYYSSGLIELDSEDQFGAAVPQPIHHHDFEAALRTTQEFVSDVAELCVVQKTSIMYSISQCDHGDDPIVGHQVTVDNISPMYKRANCSTDNHTGKGGCYLRCLGCGSPSQPVCENAGEDQVVARGSLDPEALRRTPYYATMSADASIEPGGITIKYNLFYAFNGARKWIHLGMHQADWEAVELNVNHDCTRLLGVRSSAHGDESPWDTQHLSTEFYSAYGSHATYRTANEVQPNGDSTSKGLAWFPDTVVDLLALGTVWEYPGRWGTTSQYDGIMPDWMSICTMAEVLTGKQGLKARCHKFENKTDSKAYASDLCPQGPSGPNY